MAKPSLSLPKAPSGPQFVRGKGYRHKYGIFLPAPAPDWYVELVAWDRPQFDTGAEKIYHLRKCLELLHPDSKWNEWRELCFRSLTEPQYAERLGRTSVRNISWVGAAAAGKTNNAGVFAFCWWLADPPNTCVALTSTSKGKMRQRVWPIIQECWIAFKQKADEIGLTGFKMLNSTMELRLGDDSKRAIFGQAVEKGELAGAIEKLKGVHAPRIMLVIDEAPGVEEAVYDVVPNMLKGCEDFILVNIGNGPSTHLDAFSNVCTPLNGWGTVNVEHESWRTKPVPRYQLPSGTCIHFDGTKSPNVKAGKTVYPFLYTWENWLRVKDNPTIQRTAQFWSQDRGFWPPEGFVNTVLTEELIEQGNARGQVLFAGSTIPIGSVDPAFGGDECVLRFGRMGKLANGKTAVQVTERIPIPVLVDAVDHSGNKLTVDQQIADRVYDEARKRGVKPNYFGVEATGTGRSVAAFLTQQWGEIQWIESGGKPSDMPSSEEDERPSKEVYDRKITELWFSVAAFVRGNQIGGMCDEDIVEFCSRTYEFVNRKYYLEKKEDLKPRLGRSPDSADSLAVMIFVARQHGMQTIGPRGERILSMWDREIKLQTQLYLERNLYLPEKNPAFRED